MPPPRSDTQLALLEALYQEGQKAANDQEWSELPYLVYADWLEETGDEANVARGHFVRLLCETDRHGNWAADRKGCGVVARRLLSEYRDRWVGSVAPFLPRRVSSYGCGFADLVPLRASQLAGRPAFDWTTEPNATVELRGRGTAVLDWLRDKLVGVRDLELNPLTYDTPAMDAAVGVVAANPAAADLRSLRLLCLSGNGIEALARSPHLRRLETLILEETNHPGDWFHALAWSPVVETVTQFMIRFADPDKGSWEAVEPLFASPRLHRLEALRLDEVNPGRVGMTRLLSSPLLPALRKLYVTDCGLTDAQCAPLFARDARIGLTELMLTGNRLTDRTVRAFAAAPWLSRLHGLELADNRPPGKFVGQFTADAVIELLRSPHLGPLVNFSVSVRSGGVKLAHELVRCEKLGGLRRLLLPDSRLTDRAVEVLSDAPWLGGVEELDLTGNPVSAAAVQRLRRRMPGADRVKA